MNIGFHIPWARQDSTFMSLQLLELARSLGHNVTVLPIGAPEKPVESCWDDEVLSVESSFQPWLAKQRIVIWFDVQPRKLRLSRSMGVRNILVCLWHRLKPEDYSVFDQFDLVVAPSASVLEHLQQAAPVTRLALSQWDPMTRLQRYTRTGEVQAFVTFDGVTSQLYGPMFINTLILAAERNPHVHFTIGQCRAWSPCCVSALLAALSNYPKQFSVSRRRTWPEWVADIGRHDCLINLSTRENANLATLIAMSQQVPTLAFDVRPVGDVVRDQVEGVLLPCDIVENQFGVPAATPIPSRLLSAMDGTLANRETLSRLSRNDYHERLRENRKAFRQFWDVELGTKWD